MAKHYRHLIVEKRRLIQLSLVDGKSLSEIGRSLDHGTSTISRELSRNSWSDPSREVRQRGRPAVVDGYPFKFSPATRQCGGDTKARDPRPLVVGSELRQYIERLLRLFNSPAQISGILKRINQPMQHNKSVTCP